MKKCRECGELKQLSEFHKRNTSKVGYKPTCKSCRREKARNVYIKNKSKILKRCKEYNARNKDIIKVYRNEYLKINSDKEKERSKKWARNNKKRKNAHSAKRRSKKLQRTPKWADVEGITFFYELCPIGYEVDHIIPLQGKTVSGLHVLENLQYLTKSENCRKGNKYV